MSGIAITDHECLSAHMEVNQYAKKLRETNPNFTVALGNEIYLTDTRDKGQKYYHFILIAKDEIGHKALRELSTTAWYNAYSDRNMERVPTLKKELEQIVIKYPEHLIATTACIGGELGTLLLRLNECEKAGDYQAVSIYNHEINRFLLECKSWFGDDFYLECAPSNKNDQISVNEKIKELSKTHNIKVIVGTDAHYLTEKDRMVHKAYLNSKDGEREVDDFYEFSRLMSPDECRELLKLSYEDDFIDQIYFNSLELMSKISFYSLERKQTIPKVQVQNYGPVFAGWLNNYPILQGLMNSDEIQERYWVNECFYKLEELNLIHNEEYIKRLEIEADVIKYIGEKLDDCLFAYFNTFKHYIDLFWECGSIVGPGRGSATGFLSNYLLGITQLDPIRWDLPYWRFLNKERAELPSLLLILGSCKKRTLTIA